MVDWDYVCGYDDSYGDGMVHDPEGHCGPSLGSGGGVSGTGYGVKNEVPKKKKKVSREGVKSCYYCGVPGLEWRNLDSGWRLCYRNGGPHICEDYYKKKGVSMVREWIQKLSDDELLNIIEHYTDTSPTVITVRGEDFIGDPPANNKPSYYLELIQEANNRSLSTGVDGVKQFEKLTYVGTKQFGYVRLDGGHVSVGVIASADSERVITVNPNGAYGPLFAASPDMYELLQRIRGMLGTSLKGSHSESLAREIDFNLAKARREVPDEN